MNILYILQKKLMCYSKIRSFSSINLKSAAGAIFFTLTDAIAIYMLTND